MRKQADLSYLQLRFAAANAAAEAAIDRGVKVTHQRFAEAYARRINVIVANESMIASTGGVPALHGLHPAWAKIPVGPRSRPAPAKASRPIPLGDVLPLPARPAVERSLS
jgi:hypothetical protein